MKSHHVKGIGCIVLFVTPFFLVGCGTTFLIGKHILTSLQIHRWEQVDATVVSAKARKVSSGDDGSNWEVSAEYRYAYDGQNYTGTRVGIDDSVGFGGNLRRRARLLNEAREANQPVVCYVNPKTPAEAILFRKFNGYTCSFWASSALPLAVSGLVDMHWRRMPVAPCASESN